MMKLYQIILCCAIIFSAKCDGSPQPYDAWTDTENLYRQLQNIVNTAIQTALRETRSLSSDLIVLSQRVSTASQTQIRSGSDGVKHQLSNLELLANALDRSYCLRGTDIEINFVTELLIADTRQCIYAVASDGIGVINNISLTISRAEQRIEELGERMEGCRQIDDENCVLLLKTEMQLDMDEMPTAILDEALEAVLLNREWTNSIQACADHRVGLIYTEGNRIVFDVETCLTTPTTTVPPPTIAPITTPTSAPTTTQTETPTPTQTTETPTVTQTETLTPTETETPTTVQTAIDTTIVP